jgi:hypothetical protein
MDVKNNDEKTSVISNIDGIVFNTIGDNNDSSKDSITNPDMDCKPVVPQLNEPEQETVKAAKYNPIEARRNLKTIVPASSPIKRLAQATEFVDSNCMFGGNEFNHIVGFIRANVAEHFNLGPKSSYIEDLLTYYTTEIGMVDKKQDKKKGSKNSKDDESEEESPDRIDYDEIGISQEMQDSAKAKAIEILKKGDPVQKILDTIEKTHVGDESYEELLTIAIASQSCSNTAGIQPSIMAQQDLVKVMEL